MPRAAAAVLLGQALLLGLAAPMELGQNVLWFDPGETSYFTQPVDFNSSADPWKPVVVKELRPFRAGALRMMDAGMTNRNNVSRWAQRRQKGDAAQYPTWAPAGSSGIDLDSARTQKKNASLALTCAQLPTLPVASVAVELTSKP